MNRIVIVLSLSLLVAACSAGDPESLPSSYAVSLPTTDAALVLSLVGYPGTDVTTLNHAAGLDVRAARNIVAYRVGPDGIEPSSDDLSFADLAELDAVPYVGDVAFQKLTAYATAHPAPAAEDVEGVHFRGWESQAVVWGVDHVELTVLDGLLDTRAAQALFAHRPYANVAAMGPQSFVGSAALTRLRGLAPAWWTAMRAGTPTPAGLAGTFDGVTFDETTAQVALAIANQATDGDLRAHGMTSSAATMMRAERPYGTLAQVAAISGIGPATMTALRGYAQSGQWGASSTNACVGTFESAVTPHLADLLFMSESDRAIDVVAFPGAGTAVPTCEQMNTLVHAPPGTVCWPRGLDGFYAALEPSGGTADPNAAALVQAAVTAQLTDVTYFAVQPPEGSPDHAAVDVYLLGRTTCGDLVGLHAIAIET